MTRKRAKKSVIYKWLLSYIFILAIPLIMFIDSTMRFLPLYESEIKYSDSLILEQGRTKVDDNISDAKSLVAEISISPTIRQLLSNDDGDNVVPYNLYQITKILNQLLLTGYEQFEVFLYLPSSNMVCSSYSYNDSDEFYSIYIQERGIEMTTWDEIVSSKYSSPQFFSYTRHTPNGETYTQIVMVSPSMIEKYDSRYANIVVFFDESAVINYEEEFFEHKTFLIVDSSDDVLYKSGNVEIDDIAISYNMFDNLGDEKIELEGEKLIASYAESEVADWKYVIVTKEKSYMVQLNNIKNSMYIRILLCCIIGGFVIHYIIKKNYVPLHNIVESIEAISNENQQEKINEYQYITKTIDKLKSEIKESDETIHQQRDSIKSQLLLNLVENKNNLRDIDLSTLKKYDIEFQSNYFLVLTFLIHDTKEGPFYEESGMTDMQEKYNLLSFIFQNITNELLGELNIRTYFVRRGRLFGFILNPEEKEKDLIFKEINQKLSLIKQSIHQYFLVEFSSSCSDLHNSWESIPKAFSESLEVLEYKNMLKLGKVVFYNDMVKIPKKENFYYPSDMENHIINNLKIGNKDKVIETIHKVVDMNLKDNLPPEIIRYLMVNIAGTIIKEANKIDKQKKINIPPLIFHTLLLENNVENMFSEVEENVNIVCEEICKSNTGISKLYGCRLYEKTIDFVDKNYMDKGLSVGMIADEMGIHIVHLSRTFAEYNGDSLSNYIHGVRLKHAKKLIVENMKLEDVSDSVGYGSLRTFMRVFKKYEGITPGQFKEIIKENN